MYTFNIKDCMNNILWSKIVTFPTIDNYIEANEKKEELKRELKTNQIFLEDGEI